jgi:hypothetical protein
LNADFDGVDLTLVPDMTGNGIDEIAVLGINRVTGKVNTQIKDSQTKVKINNIWFPQ